MTTTPTPPPYGGYPPAPVTPAEPAPVTGTPRTDAECLRLIEESAPEADGPNMAAFARTLEIELHQRNIIPRKWDTEYHRELDYSERLAKEYEANSDTHGMNFHQGRASALISVDIMAGEIFKELETELQNAKEVARELAAANLHGKTCVHHTDAERKEITCPVCLKRERDEAEKDFAEAQDTIAEKDSELDGVMAEIGSIRAANAALTAERDEQHRLAVERLGQCITRQEEIGTLIRERDAANVKISQYGRHFRACLGEGKCTCGLPVGITEPNYKAERDEARRERDEARKMVVVACTECMNGIIPDINSEGDEVGTQECPLCEGSAWLQFPQIIAARDTALAEAQKLRELLESATRIFDVLDTVTWDENGCPVNYRDAQKDIIRALQPR